jgi:hypothetical protein
MTVNDRINLLVQLGKYIKQNSQPWQQTKEQAYIANPWFIPEFIEQSTQAIATYFLQKDVLISFANQYAFKDELTPKTIGIVMAGNIPLVGFHDFLCCFLSGHDSLIKASSKDEILIKHLASVLYEIEVTVQNKISFAQTLKNCDAYIATGSNNSGRYFDYYFGKYPSIIRKNKTSVAVLTGNETEEELQKLASDVMLYFGQGCRNVTCLYVPKDYNFEPLINALKKYDYFIEFHKYKHNYDYQLALLMMNNKFYMTNGSVVLSENDSIFSAISHLHYNYYEDLERLTTQLKSNETIQCIVGKNFTPFGEAQQPRITQFADGVDTLKFLTSL